MKYTSTRCKLKYEKVKMELWKQEYWKYLSASKDINENKNIGNTCQQAKIEMKIRILEILVSKQRWKYENKNDGNTCQQASQQASQTLSPYQRRAQAPRGGREIQNVDREDKVVVLLYCCLINMNKILRVVVTLSLSIIVFSLWAIVSTVQSANSFLWIRVRFFPWADRWKCL